MDKVDNTTINKKKIDKLYHRIGLKYNLNKDQIRKIVESPYKFTKEKTDELDLKEIESEEDFDKLKTNFIYKYIGKLHTSYNAIKGRRKQSETFKQINKKKWEK